MGLEAPRRCYAGRAMHLISGDIHMATLLLRAFGAMLVLLGSCGAWAQASTPAPETVAKLRALPTESRTWKGDFDGMLERRHMRVLVPFSRTLFYNDKGRERGITAETARAFEQYLNKKYASQLGKRPITVYLLPTTRDELLEDVANGLGDVAAGNLTVTDARLQLVDFVAPPDAKPNREIVLSGPKSASVATAEALSGKVVHVRWTSSYHDSLVALNERLAKDGKPAVKLVPVPDELEDEDMMEMLSVGLLEYIVVDDWKARMWAQARWCAKAAWSAGRSARTARSSRPS
jgi:membrane-bound lytic murein transglycosylase MltF